MWLRCVYVNTPLIKRLNGGFDRSICAGVSGNDYRHEVFCTENAMSTDRFELVNNDAVAHNLMLLDDTVSVDVAAGETVALPVFEPGNYPFHCHIHPDMMGELVVS